MNRLFISEFSVSGVSNVCLMIIEEAGKCAVPDSKTHQTYLRLNEVYNQYQKSIDRTKKSEKSPAAAAAEKRRDKALIGARSIVSGLMRSPDMATRSKAQQVFAQLNKFGSGVERLRDDDETTKLLSIIAGLDSPSMKAIVTELNLTAYVEELRAANSEFVKLWGLREDDVEVFRNSTSACSQINDVQEAIDGYYDYVVSMSKYGGEKKEEWAKLAKAIYSRYVTLKQNQKLGKKKKDDKPTDPSKPTKPTKPSDTSKPTDSSKPSDPAKPSTPTDPVKPNAPTDPVKPANPTPDKK